MQTVLIAEDDALLRHSLRESLQAQDYLVVEALSIRRMFEIAEQHPLDAVLLDCQLADGNAIEYISKFTEHYRSPVLMMSGSDALADKITAFEQGAKDYLTKPFHLDELHARLRVHMPQEHENYSAYTMGTDRYPLGDWWLDHAQMQLCGPHERSAALTPAEFRLLVALAEQQGRVIKREQLRQMMRSEQYIPTPRAIDIKIARLRKKLSTAGAPLPEVKTVHGVGYMLAGG